MFLGDPIASDDRVEDERIVEAVVDGAHITITRLDGRGRHERTLPWSEQATFPLLARTLVRQSPSSIGPTTMFDPRHEELQVRLVDGSGARQLMVDGVRQRVAEISVTASDGVSVGSREWVGPDSRVIRRELAGPSLVAVPSSAESARAAVGGSIMSAVVQRATDDSGLDPESGLALPRLLAPRHLALDCEVHDADAPRCWSTSNLARRLRRRRTPSATGSRCCIRTCSSPVGLGAGPRSQRRPHAGC